MRWLFTDKGMLTYSQSIVAPSAKALEEWATPDVQRTFAPVNFKGGQIGEFEETPRPQRRRLADAATVVRLPRGQVEPAG